MQVPRQYTPNLVSNIKTPQKVESEEVGKALDSIAAEVQDKGVRNSLLEAASKFKFASAQGPQTRTYGLLGKALGKAKSFFGNKKQKPVNNRVNHNAGKGTSNKPQQTQQTGQQQNQNANNSVNQVTNQSKQVPDNKAVYTSEQAKAAQNAVQGYNQSQVELARRTNPRVQTKVNLKKSSIVIPDELGSLQKNMEGLYNKTGDELQKFVSGDMNGMTADYLREQRLNDIMNPAYMEKYDSNGYIGLTRDKNGQIRTKDITKATDDYINTSDEQMKKLNKESGVNDVDSESVKSAQQGTTQSTQDVVDNAESLQERAQKAKENSKSSQKSNGKANQSTQQSNPQPTENKQDQGTPELAPGSESGNASTDSKVKDQGSNNQQTQQQSKPQPQSQPQTQNTQQTQGQQSQQSQPNQQNGQQQNQNANSNVSQVTNPSQSNPQSTQPDLSKSNLKDRNGNPISAEEYMKRRLKPRFDRQNQGSPEERANKMVQQFDQATGRVYNQNDPNERANAELNDQVNKLVAQNLRRGDLYDNFAYDDEDEDGNRVAAAAAPLYNHLIGKASAEAAASGKMSKDMDDDEFENMLMYSKKMNIDNIRFFSEQSQELIIKLFAESLSEEEMQKALKWKERKNKLKRILKTVGGIGLGAAALYGASKWYNNGGSSKVANTLDKTSKFIQRTGEDAIKTGKEVVNDFNKSDLIAEKSELEGKKIDLQSKLNDTIAKLEKLKSDYSRQRDITSARLDESGLWATLTGRRTELESRLAEINEKVAEIDRRLEDFNYLKK